MREAAVLHADEKDLLGLSGEGGEEERRMRVIIETLVIVVGTVVGTLILCKFWEATKDLKQIRLSMGILVAMLGEKGIEAERCGSWYESSKGKETEG